ncbi:hypothetical protein [Paraclostridium bifermentans]|uniref:hypothetical protein n=1 Tax=Paraclostridium bifermentans TaxID=1490 RepID=UPI00359C5D1E
MSNIFIKTKDLIMDKVFRIYKSYIPEHIKVGEIEKQNIITLSEQLLNIKYTLPKLFRERIEAVDKIYDRHKPNEIIYELFTEDNKVILLLSKNLKNNSITIKWVDQLWLYSA